MKLLRPDEDLRHCFAATNTVLTDVPRHCQLAALCLKQQIASTQYCRPISPSQIIKCDLCCEINNKVDHTCVHTGGGLSHWGNEVQRSAWDTHDDANQWFPLCWTPIPKKPSQQQSRACNFLLACSDVKPAALWNRFMRPADFERLHRLLHVCINDWISFQAKIVEA